MLNSRRRMALVAVFLCLTLTAANVVKAEGKESFTVVVTAVERDHTEVPVSVNLQAPASSASVALRRADSNKDVPCQLERQGGKARVTWILRDLKRGASRKYQLSFSDKAPTQNKQWVAVSESQGAVEVTIDGELFTRYNMTNVPKPYCWPVIGPTGKPVTRSYPMEKIPGESHDHPHHKSFWFTFGDVNGNDFWAERAKIAHREFEALESGPVFGKIRAINDWIGSDGKKVCEDVRELRIYHTETGRLIDFDVTVRASDGPVTFGDTKEGMMGFRVASSMEVKRGKGRIENARGDLDRKAWGKSAEWCDYSGPVGDEIVGIAILEHPTSFRHPTYWHVRDYGLFAANPFGLRHFIRDKTGRGRYTIPKGESITFRYRIFIHRGNAKEARIPEVYAEYAEPPKCKTGKLGN